jgi:hypothetical protein
VIKKTMTPKSIKNGFKGTRMFPLSRHNVLRDRIFGTDPAYSTQQSNQPFVPNALDWTNTSDLSNLFENDVNMEIYHAAEREQEGEELLFELDAVQPSSNDKLAISVIL